MVFVEDDRRLAGCQPAALARTRPATKSRPSGALKSQRSGELKEKETVRAMKAARFFENSEVPVIVCCSKESTAFNKPIEGLSIPRNNDDRGLQFGYTMIDYCRFRSKKLSALRKLVNCR
ncbi:unnamed protein product [Angiostrongylus costaricensis]|uniref:GAF domain-containing protein n=1 Tax=Angiostrongylus costaricensis TaxID=334426 RepID=A0A0R3PVD5_ANGCS|nr:unnamed protein product [Angiostrongylus costaricensis]